MNVHAAPDAYGVLTDLDTLRIQRLLPGPIERVWAHFVDADLRRRWLAAGEMGTEPGSSFELVWRNDELTDPPGRRPDGFGEEHRMTGRITEIDPPRRLAFTWGDTGGVTIELEPAGEEVLLTVTHRRLPEGPSSLNVRAGWHAHLDLLADRLSGRTPEPHWDHWTRLKAEYEGRSPA